MRCELAKSSWFVICLFLINGCQSAASAPPPCPSIVYTTLDDMIAQSDWIGLYTATANYKMGPQLVRSDNAPIRTIEINLSLRAVLKGTPDLFIRVLSEPLPDFVPQAYFHLFDYHKDIVDGTKDVFGSNLNWQTTKEGACINIPRLIPGYTYLVTADPFSYLAYEPILSIDYDPLLDELVKRGKNVQDKP